MTTGAVFISIIIAGLNVIGYSDFSSMFSALIYLVVMIFYFIAGGKLKKQLGAENQTSKNITLLIRRMAFSLTGGLVSMLLFFALNMMRSQSTMLLMTALMAPFIVLGAPMSFAIGHHFLLIFLSGSMLKKKKGPVSSKVVASGMAASTAKQTTGTTGTQGTATGTTGTTQGDTTQGNTTVG